MSVEIDGIAITDAIQARALATQGFISDEELENILPNLDSGSLDLIRLADMQSRNLRKPILVKLKEKLGLLKKKN